MALQGFEVHVADVAFKAPTAHDQLGNKVVDVELPAGSLLLSNRQPLGHLLAAMLEFDPKLSEQVLKDERKEVLARGGSKVYDTTAWNLTMMYGLPAYMLPMELPHGTSPYSADESAKPSQQNPDEQAVAVIVDGADDRSVALAVKLLRHGTEVRISRKPFELNDQVFARGSVVVTQLDQRGRDPDWRQAVHREAQSMGVVAKSVTSGFGPGDLPDLGGDYFVRLETPRIAIASRAMISGYDYGSIWHLLDHRLHLPHSKLNFDLPPRAADLSRYNVLILPSGWVGDYVEERLPALTAWVQNGGTLIAVGSGASSLTQSDSDLSKVRRLEDVLDQLDEYELAIWREWLADEQLLPKTSSIWSHRVQVSSDFPWTTYGGSRAPIEELKRRDAWQRLFMPSGTLLAARVDNEHWLTFGCESPLPVMIRRSPVLMSKPSTETPVRLGFINSKTSTGAAQGSLAEPPGKDKPLPRPGWASVPEGKDLYLRMSGLLWPEATHRLANAAYLTRESVGDGQIIIFADSPNFRASTLGTARLLMNAIVYGPGFGARQPIRP